MVRTLRCLLLLVALVLPHAVPAKAPDYRALARLVEADRAPALRQALAAHGADEIDTAGRAALTGLAIGRGRTASLEVLVAWGVHPDQAMPFRQDGETHVVTPLLYAIASRAGVPTVKTLLRLGASPDRTADGQRPLPFALGLRQYDVAALLLDHGADPLVIDPLTRTTTLMDLAVAAPDEDAAALALGQRVLKTGVPVDARGLRGVTALRFAVFGGKPAWVRLLLAAGADPNATNDQGETPLALAQRKNQRDIAAQLLAAGARP